MRLIDTLGHLPEFYKPVREFSQIAGTEDKELKALAVCNEEDLNDAFILTGGEKGISIWEKEIGIRAEPGNETLDFRRKRIINRYTTKPPFTIRWLENQLTALLGAGFSHCGRDDEVELLTVYCDLSSLPLLREFEATIEAVLPLSMQYWKHLNAHREAKEKTYVGGMAWAHVHLGCGPA